MCGGQGSPGDICYICEGYQDDTSGVAKCCMDGVWDSWGPWNQECVEPCPETKTRYRNCYYGDPDCSVADNVSDCPGSPSETVSCNGCTGGGKFMSSDSHTLQVTTDR